MSRSSRLRSVRQLGVAAVFLALVPSAAVAADAPLRYIGIAPDASRVWTIHWVAAAEDGHEVVGTQIPSGSSVDAIVGDKSIIVSRDVVTGKTTALSGAGSTLIAASANLRIFLLRTTTSYSASDANGIEDYYVWNRDTDAKTLVSTNPDGSAIGNGWLQAHDLGDRFTTMLEPALSGDGSVVQFRALEEVYGQEAKPLGVRRVTVATGASTTLPGSTEDAFTTNMDDAGHVAVGTTGIYVDGVKKVDVPKDVLAPVISPDGSYAAGWQYSTKRVVGWNLKTGDTGSVAMPEYRGGREYPTIRYVENGGKSVIFSDIVDSADGERLAFGRVEPSGRVSQIGGDIRISDWEYLTETSAEYRYGPLGAITRNGQFAVTGLSLAQLGATPLPGTDPTSPSPAQASDYLYLNDAYCTTGGFWNLFRTYYNPTVTLAVKAQRADLRRAVSFTGTYGKTAAGSKTKTLTLTPGKPVELTGLGVNGGFTLDGTIRFSDGTTLKGAKVIGSHASPVCRSPSDF